MSIGDLKGSKGCLHYFNTSHPLLTIQTWNLKDPSPNLHCKLPKMIESLNCIGPAMATYPGAKSFRKGKCSWEAPVPSPVRSQRPLLLWGYLGAWRDTHTKRDTFRGFGFNAGSHTQVTDRTDWTTGMIQTRWVLSCRVPDVLWNPATV